METPLVDLPLLLSLALTGLGLHALLPPARKEAWSRSQEPGTYHQQAAGPSDEQSPGRISSRTVHGAGAALVFLGLTGLSVSAGRSAAWWPDESRLASPLAAAGFVLLAGLALVAALRAIVAAGPVSSGKWFAVLLVSASGLFLFAGAQFVAVVQVLLYAGPIVFVLLSAGRWIEHQAGERLQVVSREPFLACGTGVLLAAVLVGTLHYSLSVEARRTNTVSRRSAWPRESLITATAEKGEPDLVRGAQAYETRDLARAVYGAHPVSVAAAGLLIAAACVSLKLVSQKQAEGNARRHGADEPPSR